ncbi:NAD-dependent epimerase/dehydratase family protein [Amphritea pacifica]|uniref:NAD-dependent epimerase/dehydratase family protein n=1 Tax=Amphritea pacifica TaxID=2811233 RepID=UPI00196271C2|nr:SDR family oxidoreductase [Amphritea pacifica]MBN1005319.1 SDR family oxidoreductase [Amphritea pacifica]
MKSNILITGGAGFIATNIAMLFHDNDFNVYGIGRSKKESDLSFYNFWIEDSVSIESLKKFDKQFDLIVHCGGGSSVGAANDGPYIDFEKTVSGTAAVLEYARLYNNEAHIIYPSSPAVHGQHNENPINEMDVLEPVSVYGFHKKMAEEIVYYYNKIYGLKSTVIRFYSVYGNGLKKQLLWDACNKLVSNKKAVFWGGGDETRDWLHVSDAADLIYFVYLLENPPLVINGGSGKAMKITEVISVLKTELGSSSEIIFNGCNKVGDPKFYCADMKMLEKYGWNPKKDINKGFHEYAQWFIGVK